MAGGNEKIGKLRQDYCNKIDDFIKNTTIQFFYPFRLSIL
jgi:hypothetical protein